MTNNPFIEAKQFWEGKLNADLPSGAFPADAVAKPGEPAEPADYPFELPTDLALKTVQMSAGSDERLIVIFIAGLAGLLTRYSQSDDYLIFMPIHRQETAGKFINTLLPLSDSIPPTLSFKELILQVWRNYTEAVAHQNYPVERLLKKDFSAAPKSGLALGTAAVLENIHDDQYLGQHQFQAVFSFERSGERIRGTVRYHPAVYRAETIAGIVAHFISLLRNAYDNLEVKAARVEILSPAERQRLLSDYNRTDGDFPQDRTIQQLFEDQVKRGPEQTALVFGERKITYRQLNAHANRLAWFLRRRGVRPGDTVGMIIDRSCEMIIAILGILKAGGVYLPVDPQYPADRIRFMLEDSQSGIVLTNQDWGQVNFFPGEIIDIRNESVGAGESDQDLDNRNRPDDPGYLIYTSGSTGRPKGAALKHLGVSNLKAFFETRFGITREDRIIQFASSSFDASVWEIFMALLNGAALHLLKAETIRNSGDFEGYLNDHQITVVTLPPTYLATLNPENVNTLRLLVTAGSATRWDLARRWKGKCRYINAYGPTETTVCATVFDCGEPVSCANVPIGKPIPNAKAYILDRNGGLLPAGIAGELCIGGPMVGIGYHNRTELTREKFVDNPYLPGTKMYKTGDLARWLPDGNIEFLGRMDHQVKIRGYRIEPGEIEQELLRMEAIAEALVVEGEDPGGATCLCAYYTVKPEAAGPSPEQLRAGLSQTLPDYMIPGFLVPLTQFPLTPNGKIDRRALPGPSLSIAETYMAPRTELEKVLVKIWREILAVEPMGIRHHFFRSGGDSIKAIQMISRLKREGYLLTIQDLFASPAIEQLVHSVRVAGTDHAAQEMVTGAVKLTPIQEWFVGMNLSKPDHFNQHLLLAHDGELDAGRVRRVFQKLIEHHDALRTTVTLGPEAEHPHRATQSIHAWDPDSLSLEVVDLRPAGDWKAGLTAEADRIQSSLNLAGGPLLKLGLFRTRRGDYLLIVIHHWVIDGVSWRILMEDFFRGYEADQRGEAITLDPKTRSYQEWAEQLAGYAQSPKIQKELSYWREVEASLVPLPKDYPVSGGRFQDLDTVRLELGPEETGLLLRKVNQAYNTEINDILLTALTLAVREWAGADRLCVNLEGHGREAVTEDIDVSRTVGWFTSQYPVVLKCDGSEPLSLLIKRTKEHLRRIPQRGMGFGLLKYMGNASENGLVRPRPDLSFNYLGQTDELENSLFKLADFPGGTDVSPESALIDPISINGFIKDGRLSLTFVYYRQAYRPDSMEQFAAAYRKQLEAVIRHCAGQTVPEYTPSDYGLALELESLEMIHALIRESLEPGTAATKLYSLAPMQEGILFHGIYQPNSRAYFLQELFQITGDLDIPAFEACVERLGAEHEVLRTCFVYEKIEEPVQVVLNRRKIPVICRDFSGITDHTERERIIHELLVQDREKGFDLFTDSLLRVIVMKITTDSYRILWSFHHILMDGWCISQIFGDLFTLYEARLRQIRPELKSRTPFERHIQWLKQRDRDQSRLFWQNYLAGYEHQATLPKSNLKPGNGEFQTEKIRLVLEETIVAQLTRIAGAAGITINILFQALWGILLQKYNNTDDVVFGTVVSGRPPELADVENMIGLFINTVPVRIRRSGPGFIQLLQAIRQDWLAMKEHEYCPLAEIQSQSPLNQDLLDHILVLENYPFDTAFQELFLRDRLGFDIEHVEFNEHNSFDLSVIVMPDRQYTVEFRYNALVYGTARMERLSRHLLEIIRSVCANPDIDVAAINMLTEAEELELLYRFHPGEILYPREKTIHQLFGEQARRTPERVAVSFENQTLTYRELNRKSDNLAAYLNSQGIQTGDIVAIMTEKSVETVVGTLAVLKAGGAYLPIDPNYPAARITYMLEDSGARFLLSRNSLLAGAEWAGLGRLVGAADIETRMNQTSDASLPGEKGAGASDLAYIIYTSGTTGKPKGVMIEHRNVVRLLFNNKFPFEFGENDVWTMFHSHCFDFSVWEMYGALLYGGKLVVISKTVARDPERFAAIVETERVTVLNQTPSAFFNLMPAVLRQCPGFSLRYIVFGGEALKPAGLLAWIERYPAVKLINMYGITETTVHVTFKEIGINEIRNNISNIGLPLPDLTAYVMDRRLKLLPKGCAGELCVGGAGVGRGYLHRPELTDAKFIRHPYKPEERLYRSGDLVRQLETGELEYLGRIDQQVKIRGFRIELGEIEQAILQNKAVKETVVVAGTDAGGNQYLVGYYLADREYDYAYFKEYLAVGLPDYMIPAYFIRLEALPLTGNGKVDRGALPQVRIGEAKDYAAPRNEREDLLVKLWQSVLGVEKVGVRTNFFEIGGDSIKSIQMSSRLRKYGYKMEIRDLFRHPTIEQLAPLLKEDTLLPGEAGPVTGRVYLSPVQNWFFHLRLQDQHHFNQQVMLYRADGFDETIVRKVFIAIAIHHDALRMRFDCGEGVAQYNQGLEAELFDLRVFNLTAAEMVADTVARQAEAIQSSIDLTQGPLVKLGLFQTSSGDHLLIVIHHLVIDGVSWRILMEDFTTGYEQALAGKTIRFPEKTASFQRWSERLYQYGRQSKQLQQEKVYWEHIETEIKPLPGNASAVKRQSGERRTVSVTLSEAETTRLLREVNQAYNTGINDLLLTALGLALRECFGPDRFVINLEGHGRETLFPDLDVSRTIGWFTSQYPVLLQVGDSGDLGRQIKRTKENLRQIPGKGLGYGLLRYGGDSFPDPPVRQPEISFNYLGQMDEDIRSAVFTISALPGGSPVSPKQESWYLLNMNALIINHRFTMEIDYHPEDFSAAVITEFSGLYRRRLQTVLEHCAAREFPELTPSDYGVNIGLDSLERLRDLVRQRSGGAQTIENIYPLSPMQEGMLFHHIYDRNSAAYFEQFIFDLCGTPDLTVMEACLQSLSRKYAVLRTCFVYENIEKPVQVVLNERQLLWICADLSGLTPDQKEKRLQELTAEDRERGFDLSGDGLLRVTMVRTDANRYKMIWSFHHIIMDGWCTSLIYADFFSFYESLKKGVPPEMKEAVSYADYIKWLAGQDREKALAFWEDYLEGYEQTALLPKSRIPAGKTGYRLKKERLFLDADWVRRIEKLAARCKVTPNVILQTLWGILLQKYNNSDDVIFGAVVSGRPPELPEIETCVGLFINTVPVRIRNRGMQFDALLQQVQNEALQAREFQYSPLVEVQALSRLKTQLFDHIVVYENYPVHEKLQELELEERLGFTVTHGDAHDETNYDLFITVLPAGERWEIQFNYNSGVYEDETIQRIMAHFREIAAGLTEKPDTDIRSVSVLTRREKAELLTGSRRRRVQYGADRTLVEIFEAQAGKTPDRTAVVFEDRTLTYRELNEKANCLASLLRSSGVTRDSIVGLLLDRSLEMVVGMIAILKAGGAYLPIDPDYPPDRIRFMLSDSRTGIVVTTQAVATKIPAGPVRICADDPSLYRHGEPNPERINQSADLAYIIYTSGTTGLPKGVMVEHRNVVRLFFHNRFQFDFDATDVWTMFHSHCFDFSVWEIYGALLFGGKLIVIPKMAARDPRVYLEALKRHRVTVLNQTPSAFYNLSEEELKRPGQDLSLRYVIFGGEALQPKKLEFWHQKYPQVALINMFGITETTVHVTYKRITVNEIANNISNIGRPILNLYTYILDKDFNPVPRGAAGELYVGGAGVSRGYLNREELTGERFIPDPFRPERRMYRSGDLVRMLSNGEMEYLGRIDHQVQLKGFRIELGEIESRMLQIDAVAEVTVMARKAREDRDYLAAYYTLRQGVSEAELRDGLTQNLPDYMIPAYFVRLEKIPLTPNGKVDREALPEPEVSSWEYRPPRNDCEAKLAGLWAFNLGLETVSIDDNYFVIGGDSIKAIRLVNRINMELGGNITIRDLYLNPTVTLLASHVTVSDEASRLPEASREILSELEEIKAGILRDHEFSDPANIIDIYPMSDIEKGMFYYTVTDPALGIYHDQMVRIIEWPRFDFQLFTRALQFLIEEHPILRTGFLMPESGEPVQIVYQTVLPELTHENIGQLTPREQMDLIGRAVSGDRQRPFQWSEAPLWRMSAYTLDESQVCLFFACHHAIIDGWSDASLMTELNNVYLRLKADRDYVPAKLQSSYKDYVIAELLEKRNEVTRAFWRKELEDYQKIPLPNLSREYILPEQNRVEIRLENHLCEALLGLTRQAQISLKHLLFAAFVYAFNMLTYDNDVTVGIVVNNRPSCADGDRILGCFLNTVPVRIHVPHDITWEEYLKRVDRKLLSLKSYERLSLLEITKLMNEKSQNVNPCFDVLFNYVDFHIYHQLDWGPAGQSEAAAAATDNVKTESLSVSGKVSTNTFFDLSVDVTGEAFELTVDYAPHVFTSEDAQAQIDYFTRVLTNFVHHPHQRVSKNDLIFPAEKQRLLVELSHTHQTSAPYPTVMEWFERQAALTPDRIAVQSGHLAGDSLTYRQLNRQANQLAGLLRSKGVTPDQVVGILLEKSVAMVTAVWGVLKSGGAYLPLDPAYPAERLRYMAAAGGAGWIITESRLKHLIPAGAEGINIEDIPWDSYDPADIRPVNQPSDLAYVIFTSGSTGAPKGVTVEHRNLVNIAQAWREDYRLEQFTPNLLQLASFSFDVFTGDLARCLLNGGKLVLCPERMRLDFAELYRLLVNHRIRLVESTPALLVPFLNYVAENGLKLESLKLLILGSDVCRADDFTTITTRFGPEIRVLNSYGVTEATIDSSYYEATPETCRAMENVPIGKPLPNVEFYLLDRELDLQPAGAVGELYIGGPGVARGYLNCLDPNEARRLSETRFIPNPFKPGTRIYKTGDLARWLPDGNLAFLGRGDAQVKIRGYRIETGEIEDRLLKHPGVGEAVVVAAKDPAGLNFLCAYYVPKTSADSVLSGSEAERTESMRTYLGQYLPEYMLPACYVLLKKMPLTVNGKIDRKALPQPEFSLTVDDEAPADETEAILLTIFREVLGVKNLGVQSDFFNLGGDSIKVIQVASRLRKFGLQMEMKDLFQNPTVRAARPVILKNTFSRAEQGTVTGPAPLTPIQSAFFRQQSRGRNHYNQSMMLFRKEGFEAEPLKKTLGKITEHHDALRMVYSFEHETDGRIGQFNQGAEGAGFAMQIFDWRTDPDPQRSIVEKSDQIQAGIDLERGPLVKAGLFKTGSGDHLLLVIHHLVVDGVSWRILLEDLADGYEQALRNEAIVFPEKTHSFREWSQALRQYARTSAELRRQKEYWERIAGQPVKELPKDNPAVSRMNRQSDTVYMELPPEATASLLKEAHQAYNTEINDLLLTGLGWVVGEWSGANRILLNLEGHGREELIPGMDISRTVGWFTCEYPLLLELPESADLAFHIKSVKERLRSIPQKGIGYGILKESGAGISTCAPEISFNYLGEFNQGDDAEVFAVSDLSGGRDFGNDYQTPYALDINGMVHEGKLGFAFIYDQTEYRRETVQALAENYRRKLLEIIEHCRSQKVKECTPSDYGAGDLSLAELESIKEVITDLEL